METEFDRIEKAAEHLQVLFGDAPPVGVVLGSGLGGLMEAMTAPDRVPYSGIPNWILPSVEGHAGELIVGNVGDVRCAMLSGRPHLYEGYSSAEVVRHVRTLRLWGVRVLVLTCAAGGIFHDTQAGELMVITDHLNLTGHHPLIGKYDKRLSTHRFPDTSNTWNDSLNMVLRLAFLETRITMREGIHAGLMGPTYETPAEVDMLEIMGASSVGMSVVLENLAFSAMPDSNGLSGLACGVAMLANPAAGRGNKAKLEHADVLVACQVAGGKLVQVLKVAIPLMPSCLI